MQCDLCERTNGHVKGCPNYKPPQARHMCSACEMGIYEGEEYLENDYGDYRHFDCFNGMRDLLEWLRFDIRKME